MVQCSSPKIEKLSPGACLSSVFLSLTQILLLTGDPKDRPFLLHMANMITKRLSLLQCVNIVSEDLIFDERNEMWTRGQRWLTDNRIKAFYTISRSDKYKEGVRYEFTKKLIHKIETSSKRSSSVVRASNS